MSNSDQTLRFPYDKMDEHDDYIIFKIFKYQPPFKGAKCLGQGAGGIDYGGTFAGYDITGFGAEERTEYKPMVLFMPEDIRDAHTRDWGTKAISNVAREGLKMTSKVLDQIGTPSTQQGLQGFADRMKAVAPNQLKTQAGALAKSMLGQGVSGALGVEANVGFGGVLGEVLNPNLEVMFSGPGMREFQFQWTMVPRNAKEAIIIKEIIWQFKRASAPTIKKDGWFLSVPNIFKIQYKTGSKDNHWLNKMKGCALTAVDVDYTAAGSWSTLKDGSPTATTLTLNFKELKMILGNDLGDKYEAGRQYY